MKLKMDELTSQLNTEKQLSKSRLIEVEELLKTKKELNGTISKYESGDIPIDILERATSYLQLKRDSDDNSRQLKAMTNNDLTMRDNMENMRKKHAKLEREMNMAMHKLKGTYEDLVKSLAKEKQSYANYADELKIKLQLQTRQTTRIIDAEKREEELSKLIEHQRDELKRLQKERKDNIQKDASNANGTQEENEKKDLANELATEIEQLGEAFGKTEKQNLDLLKQLKFLKKQKFCFSVLPNASPNCSISVANSFAKSFFSFSSCVPLALLASF
jgi:hypothetical protein